MEEMADLYFMTLVLLTVKGITLPDVYQELINRKKPLQNTTTRL